MLCRSILVRERSQTIAQVQFNRNTERERPSCTGRRNLNVTLGLLEIRTEDVTVSAILVGEIAVITGVELVNDCTVRLCQVDVREGVPREIGRASCRERVCQYG